MKSQKNKQGRMGWRGKLRQLLSILRNGNVAKSWLVSYLLLISIPIAFSIGVYFVLEANARKNVEEISALTMDSFIRSADTQLKRMQSVYENVIFDESLKNVLSMETPFSPQDMMEFYHLNNKLRAADTVGNNVTLGMYLVCDRPDVVLSRNSVLETDTFIRECITREETGAKKIRETWAQSKVPHFFSTQILREDRPVPVMAYIRGLPVSPVKENQGALVVYVSQNEMLSPLEDMRKKLSADCYILDEAGAVLATTDESGKYQELLGSKEEKIRFQEEYYLKYVTPSGFGGLSYVTVVPYSTITKSVYEIRVLLVALTILCVLICFVAMLLILYKNYNPFQSLLSAVGVDTAKRNEYDALGTAWFSNTKRMGSLQKTVFSQKQILKGNYLRDIVLHGVNGDIDSQNLKEVYDLTFLSQAFAVILIQISDYGILSEGEDTVTMDVVAANVFEELAGRRNLGYVVNIGQAYALLLSIAPEREEEYRNDVEELAEIAAEELQRHFQIQFNVYAGSIHHYLAGVCDSYQEAEKLFYDAADRQELVSFYQKEERDGIVCLTNENEQQFLSKMKSGEEGQTLRAVDYIFSDFSPNTEISEIKGVGMAMVNALQRVVSYVEGQSNLCNEALKSILDAKNTAAVKLVMYQMVKEGCAFFRERKVNTISTVANAYINGNYGNPNLSLSAIAEHLGLHPSYLSSVYKEQTGHGIVEYINDVRIEQAARLLRETKATVAAVSEQAGFGSTRTFIRIFKKQMGETPSEYRVK